MTQQASFNFNGQDISIRLTNQLVLDVQQAEGLDLADISKIDQVVGLETELRRLARVLRIIISDQVDVGQFDGEALYNGLLALLEAIVNFTPRSKREAAKRAIAAVQAARAKAVEQYVKFLNSPEFDEQMDRTIQTEIDKAFKDIMGGLPGGNSVANSPGSAV